MKREAKRPPKIKNLFIRVFDHPQRTLCVHNLTEDDTVEMLGLTVHLRMLHHGYNVPRAFADFDGTQHFIFAGKYMDFDWKPLRYYGVRSESTIHMLPKPYLVTARDNWRYRLRRRA